MTEAFRSGPQEGHEPLQITIAETIRFHHLGKTYVRDALLGQVNYGSIYLDPSTIGIFDKEYHKDVFGEEKPDDIYHYVNSKYSYLKHLVELPDEAWIKLTIQPDGICESCVIGRHCTAENYTNARGQVVSTFHGEEVEAARIEARLMENDCKPNVDYFWVKEPYVLYYFDFEKLQTTSETTEFTGTSEAIVVRKRDLKKLAEQDFDKYLSTINKIFKESHKPRNEQP